MRVYKGTTNATDIQVENGCGSLYFIVKKPKTGRVNLVKFFGDDNISTADTLHVRYCSRQKGQSSIIPTVPILPLAIAGTTGPNHIAFMQDTGGLIDEVRFSVQIGVNGALALDGNSYLSVTTNFTDITSLEVYAIDGHKTPLAYTYTVEHFNAGTQKDMSLIGLNQIILPKTITKVDMAKGDGYMVSMEAPELEDIARSLNDVMAIGGTEITWSQQILGQSVPMSGGLRGTVVYSGGTFYNAIGSSDFLTAKIISQYDCRVYGTRAIDTNYV